MASTDLSVRLVESHRMRADDENGKDILAVARAFDQGESHPAIIEPRFGCELPVPRGRICRIARRHDGPGRVSDRWHRDLIRSCRDINDLVGAAITVQSTENSTRLKRKC